MYQQVTYQNIIENNKIKVMLQLTIATETMFLNATQDTLNPTFDNSNYDKIHSLKSARIVLESTGHM